MRHAKIKGMGKRNKRNHITHFSMGPDHPPICKTNNKGRTTSFREETTCERCKKTPQFLIKDYEHRFLGKTY